jgi:chromosome segregation ATPase
MESNSSKMAELAEKLREADLNLVQARSALAEEQRTSERLRGELAAAQATAAQIPTLEATIGGLRAEVRIKDQSMADLRHSQSTWTSMFVASNSSINAQTFVQVLNAQAAAAATAPSQPSAPAGVQGEGAQSNAGGQGQ